MSETSDASHARREARLQQLTRWAAEIPAPLTTLHERHGAVVHLRPTSSGVTLIGLTPDRPQRGKGGFRDLAALVDGFEAVFAKYCMPEGHGRATPEKALQSGLIRDAYLHQRRMEMLRVAAPSDHEGRLLFVTDEIALPIDDGGGEITCDLICLLERSDGYTPLVVELKSAREKARLIEQVEGYASLVEEHRGGFEAMMSALFQREMRLTPRCERWIVWPAAGKGPDRHAPALAERGIHLVTYEVTGPGFVLRNGLTG